MYEINPEPKTDQEGFLNHLKLAANANERGEHNEVGCILSDMIDMVFNKAIKVQYRRSSGKRDDVARFCAEHPELVD